VLDEPTAGMGRADADVLIALLLRLREAGTAILVASREQALIDAADHRSTLG
jgi:putative ABC transport system ATP-binding protein/lipoprotein-releasing system ATP-binding protein